MSGTQTRRQRVVATNSRRRRRFTKAEKKTYAISMRAAADLNKSLVETKRIAETFTGLGGVSASGNIERLFTIPKGQDDGERDGDEIHLKGMSIRLKIIYSDSTNIVRIIVFKWMAETTDLLPSNILTSTGSVEAPLQSFKREFRRDYRILYDNTFALGSGSNPVQVEKIFLQRLGKVLYTTGDTAGTSLHSGGVYMLQISDSTASGHPVVSMHVSTTFTDQ